MQEESRVSPEILDRGSEKTPCKKHHPCALSVDRGGLKKGVSRFGLVRPDLSFLCLLWDFPFFASRDCYDMWGEFPVVSFSSILGLLKGPMRNIPARVRDTIRNFREKMRTPQFGEFSRGK